VCDLLRDTCWDSNLDLSVAKGGSLKEKDIGIGGDRGGSLESRN